MGLSCWQKRDCTAAERVLGVRSSTPNILVYKELQPKSWSNNNYSLRVKDEPFIQDLIGKACNSGIKYVKYYDQLAEHYTSPEKAFKQQNDLFHNENSSIKREYCDIFENFTKAETISEILVTMNIVESS